ncbi:MAG: MBL fold metallo-hydrolase [Chitinophagales bacterium]|nr:MBL fold metallo-hydrolase [Chitinophagales bacterium]
MQIFSIDTGYFKLDGGAMFGVVPKTMWQKLNPPDENNLCTWAMRCLLIQDKDKLILIDSGIGNNITPQYQQRYFTFGEDTLEKSLAKHGFSTEDITDVIYTHLHFDHCSGALNRSDDGTLSLKFPNATYWTNNEHWNWAMEPNPREQASFLKENLNFLLNSNQLKFVDNEEWSFTNIEYELMYGHTHAMMIFHIYKDDQTISYCADLIPSHHHIKLPYIMAYDVQPLETLKEKHIFLEKALENNHILVFEHDKDIEACTLKRTEKGIVFDKLISINEI